MHEVVRGGRADTDDDLVAVVNDIGQIEEMPEQRRRLLRYVMVSHDNDGVTKFGTDLLLRQPAWLQGPRSPIVEMPRTARAESQRACAGDRSRPSSSCWST